MKYLAGVDKIDFRHGVALRKFSKKWGRWYILDKEEKATIHTTILESWLKKQLLEFINCQLFKSQTE